MKEEVLLIAICNVLRLMNEPIHTLAPSPIIIENYVLRQKSDLQNYYLIITKCSILIKSEAYIETRKHSSFKGTK